MWMCDNCQAINDDGDAACPKCRRSRVQQGATANISRPTGPPAPSFGKSLGSPEAPEASATNEPPTFANTGNYGGPANPNYTAPRGSTGLGLAGPAILLALMLVWLLKLLNPGRLLLLAGGVACIWGGNYLMHRNDAFKSTAVKTTGTVVRLDERGTADDKSYYPVAMFRTAKGGSDEVTSSVGSRPASNHVGDTVTVYYNPKSPSDAIIDSSINNLMPIILIVIGGVIVLAALASVKPSS